MSDPLNWPAIELALRSLVVEAAQSSAFDVDGDSGTRVFWTDQDHPIGDRPFVTLRTSGTIPLAPPERATRLGTQIVNVSILVAAAQVYTATIAGVASTYSAGGGDTLDTIRDGLIAAITVDQGAAPGGPFATAAILSAGVLQVTATAVGLDLLVSVDPAPDIASAIVVDSLETLTLETDEFSLSVEAFAVFDDASPARSQHAKILAECIRAWFTRIGSRAMLCDAGLGYLRREAVVDLSTLEGSQHETRAAVDLYFSARSVTIEQTGAVACVDTPGTTAPPTPSP